jgi:predicted SAM-dependent methyltransferase
MNLRNTFDNWWNTVYLTRPKEIHRQCFEEGYLQGYTEALKSTKTTTYILLGAVIASVVSFFVR